MIWFKACGCHVSNKIQDVKTAISALFKFCQPIFRCFFEKTKNCLELRDLTRKMIRKFNFFFGGGGQFWPPPRHLSWKISANVDGGPSVRSSMPRPGNEDPHRRERNSCRLKSIRFLTNEISGIARIFQKIQNFLSGNRKGACPFLYPQRLSHSNYFWTLLYTTSTDRLCTHTCGAHTVLG